MNTKFKKFLSISLLLCLLNISIKPNAKTETFTYTIPDKKIEDFSLSEIESIIGEHLKNLNLNYSVGSTEYESYLRNFLFGNDTTIKDTKLIHLFNAYAATYLNETSKNMSNTKRSFNTNNKTIKMIKQEILNEENNTPSSPSTRAYKGYNYSAARNYALKHAFKYNNADYASFSNRGGDCTNFVSQILVAGGIPKNNNWYFRYVPNPSNYPPRKETFSRSWVSATDFYNYWKNKVPVIDGRYKDNIIPHANVGDIIQYYEINTGIKWHSVFVSGKTSNDLRITQHTGDRKDDLWKGTVGPIGPHGGSETYFKLLKFR